MVYDPAPYIVSSVPSTAPGLSLVIVESATPPANPAVGQRWRDTSLTPPVLRIWDGSAWAVALDAENLLRHENAISGHETRIANLEAVPQNTQAASYTLILADAGKVVEMNVAAANTLTVPPNSAVAFPVGTVIEVYQMGAGATTIVAGTGVTIRSAGGSLALRTQYATASLRKRSTDAWVLAGDLA